MKSNCFRLLFFALFFIANMAFTPAPKMDGRFFMSNDRGATWASADTGFPEKEFITSWINDGDKLIAGTANHGIYLFDSQSKTWSAANDGLPAGAKIRDMIRVNDALLISEAELGMFVSFDGGKQWASTTAPGNWQISVSRGTLRIRCLFAANQILYAGTDEGIYRSEGVGKAWTHMGANLQVNDFIQFRGNLFAATNRGIVKSSDGKRWEPVSDRAVSRLSLTEKEIAAVAFDGTIMISDREGKSWMTLAPILESQYTFQITPTGSRVLIEPWMKTLPFLNSGQGLNTSALPRNIPFSTMIPLSGAILILDATKDGC
jgi:photosystem II stability/assembly factor-like uncharacterized protein